jgi:hypothetical protein
LIVALFDGELWEVADALANLDKLAKDVLSKGATKQVAPSKSYTWLEGKENPNDGIAVLKFDGKIQSLQPMSKSSFDRLRGQQ